MKYNNVIQWDQLEVASWLDTRGYKTDLHVTGDILLQLSEKQIKPLISNGIVRKRLCRDLKNLKKEIKPGQTQEQRIKVAHFRLCHSRKPFVVAYPGEA